MEKYYVEIFDSLEEATRVTTLKDIPNNARYICSNIDMGEGTFCGEDVNIYEDEETGTFFALVD